MNVEQILNNLTDLAMSLGGKIIAALLVLVIGLKISKILLKVITTSRAFTSIEDTAETFLKSVINIALKVVVFITAIGVLGVPLTSVITVVASCGVAVGLALQGGLSNLAGGIIIIILKPFRVGDYIDDKNVNGSVEAIGIFYTTLITPDNKRCFIPNGTLMNSTVTASNQLDTRRVDFEFSVAYNENLEKVKELITNTALANGGVLKDKGVDIFVAGYADGAIRLSVRLWTKTDDYWNVYFDVNEKVKDAFDANGVTMPLKQVAVNVNNK